MKPYNANIEKETLDNEFYRKVLHTGKKLQLVVMTLKAGEDIPLETHDDIDQFIRIEQGSAKVTIEDKEFDLADDDVIIIPAGAKHHVVNTGEGKLKLYSIYAGPEHPEGTLHKTKADDHHH